MSFLLRRLLAMVRFAEIRVIRSFGTYRHFAAVRFMSQLVSLFSSAQVRVRCVM